MNNRDKVEQFLQNKFKHITSFNSESFSEINEHKNSNFGLSNLAFAMYSNGNNLRGQSSHNPMGLYYNDGQNIFSIGYFRKEGSAEGDLGYLFFVAPTGKNVLAKLLEIIETVRKSSLPISGYYIRYATLGLYRELLNSGGFPIKEYPWHPEAPEEDETFTNALVTIDEVVSVIDEKVIVKKIKGLSKNSSRKVQYAVARFENFLKRENSTYKLKRMKLNDIPEANNIIHMHFDMLTRLGKNIGSTTEDHANSINPALLENDQVYGYIGYLDELPVTLFVGESLGEETFGLYTPFTLREINIFKSKGTKKSYLTGLTAMPTYAYVQLFANLLKEGHKYIDLGGSELADLNKFKRQFGGKNNPTYWVYFDN